MANSLTFNQAVTVFNSLIKQAKGDAALTAVDTSTFVSIGQAALLSGIDPLAQGISQVLDKTIFSVRPYYAKFKAMEKSDGEFGAWQRKINYCDTDFVQDDGYPLTDGTTIDQYVIRKPDTIQLNFYGMNILADYITRTEEQLKVAFRSPEEFGEFFSGALQNLSDKHEQKTEAVARGNLVNAITGVVTANNTNQRVKLLTEYNTLTGQSLTATTVMNQTNYEPFMKWVYARIQQARDLLTERSTIYHLNVTSPNSKKIARHTPYNRQVLYMYAPQMRQMQARVLSGAFNEGRLAYKDIELVNYWQDINDPWKVSGIPVYMGADGSATIPQNNNTPTTVTVDKIFALLADDEAMGYRRYSEGMYATPLNARGRYTNLWYRWKWQQFVDYTENMIVFTLD